jgi:hypothetical protein
MAGQVGDLEGVIRARRGVNVSVVMTRTEAGMVLGQLAGDKWLIASLLAARYATAQGFADHELGAAAYAIRAARAAAPTDECHEAAYRECRWQRAQLPSEIRALVLDDQRLRNKACWSLFDCL